jgi:hypothetical protein
MRTVALTGIGNLSEDVVACRSPPLRYPGKLWGMAMLRELW